MTTTCKALQYGDMRGICVVNTVEREHDHRSRATCSSISGRAIGGVSISIRALSSPDNECSDTQGAFNLNGRDERGSSAPGPFVGTRKLTADGNKLCPISGPAIALENNAKASEYTVTNAKACP